MKERGITDGLTMNQLAERNAEYVATIAALEARCAALRDDMRQAREQLEVAERQNGYLREQRDEWERKAISNFEECAEMSARTEELEAQRKLAFTASNRWADKFREADKSIAELEAREVTLPPLAPENLASVLDGYEKWLIATTFRDTWNACLSEVVRMNAADIKVKG